MWKRLQILILAQLKQGFSPRALALSCAVAYVFATMPFYGITTFFCFVIAHRWRLNQAVTQAVNYLLAPVQILLIPVHLRLGEWILQTDKVSINPEKMFSLLFAEPSVFFALYGWAVLHALFAWSLLAPCSGVVVYFLLKPIFTKLLRQGA